MVGTVKAEGDLRDIMEADEGVASPDLREELSIVFDEDPKEVVSYAEMLDKKPETSDVQGDLGKELSIVFGENPAETIRRAFEDNEPSSLDNPEEVGLFEELKFGRTFEPDGMANKAIAAEFGAKFCGCALNEDKEVVAVMTNHDGSDAWMETGDALEMKLMVGGDDLDPEVKAMYNEALGGIHFVLAEGSQAELQTISNAADLSGQTLREAMDSMETVPEMDSKDGFFVEGNEIGFRMKF